MGNVIAALCDKITFQKVQPDISPVLSFPGLEIKQHQRRVLRDGNEVPLTRNEYGVAGLSCRISRTRLFQRADI